MSDTETEYTVEAYDPLSGEWRIHESFVKRGEALHHARALRLDLRDVEFAKVRVVTTTYEYQ